MARETNEAPQNLDLLQPEYPVLHTDYPIANPQVPDARARGTADMAQRRLRDGDADMSVFHQCSESREVACSAFVAILDAATAPSRDKSCIATRSASRGRPQNRQHPRCTQTRLQR